MILGMSALSNKSLDELFHLTLKQFFYITETAILDDWDHTATIKAQVQNLFALVGNFFSDKSAKIPFNSTIECNPYRSDKGGHKITVQNFKSLKGLGKSQMNRQ